MGFYRGPKIITDGLVLYLDAANTKSYVSSSTTTNSLVGSVTGSLLNGVGFSSENNGSWTFDGSNDYVGCGNIINFERTDSFSINSWINITSLSVFRAVVTKMNSSYRGYAFLIEPTSELTFILRNTLSTNSLLVRTSVSSILTNKWFNIAVTYSGNSLPSGVNFYINSVTYPVNTIVNNTLTQTTITTEPLNIGARTAIPDGYFSGRISQTQIYNRVLSADEVLQNYNATKSRFGL